MKQKPVTPTLPPWTLADTFAAYRDGWGLFQTDDGGVVIQRLDDPGACPVEANVPDGQPQFDCDENAVAHVHNEAREGKPLAQRALEFVRASNGIVPWA